jgi:hypothetical protein
VLPDLALVLRPFALTLLLLQLGLDPALLLAPFRFQLLSMPAFVLASLLVEPILFLLLPDQLFPLPLFVVQPLLLVPVTPSAPLLLTLLLARLVALLARAQVAILLLRLRQPLSRTVDAGGLALQGVPRSVARPAVLGRRRLLFEAANVLRQDEGAAVEFIGGR